MTGSMAAAMILTDLVQGRKNEWQDVFATDRNMRKMQLVKNGLVSAGNLLTPTKPRCTHMGCTLKWNRQEHTWDCPCHGSRFAKDGDVIDNPAKRDLEKISS